MVNKKFFGMLAMVLTLGMMLAGCEDPNSGGGTYRRASTSASAWTKN